MRTYIFSFPQTKAIKLGLKLNELLLLDYLYKLFNTGLSKVEVRGKKHYYKITYKKILGDLPILGIGPRMLRNLVVGLEKIGVVTRLRDKKYEMFLCVDFEKILEYTDIDNLDDEQVDNELFNKTKVATHNSSKTDNACEMNDCVVEDNLNGDFFNCIVGNKFPITQPSTEINCRLVGNKLPTIDNINKNKILKIKMNKENACATHDINININKFNEIMHSYIDKRFSQVTKDMYLKRFRLLLIVDEMMLFETDYLHVLEANFKTKIEDIANLVLEDLRQD